MFTVIIADDHPLFRAALCQVIGSLFAEHRILEASTLAEARALISGAKGGGEGGNDDSGRDVRADTEPADKETDTEPDLILLDLQMPGSTGFSGLVELRNVAPAVPIVVVSAATQPSIARDSITYGAAGFIPKSFSRNQIGQALRQVINGEVFVPWEAAGDDTLAVGGDDAPAPLHDRLAALTQGELRVFERLAKGKSNKIIAYELGIKESTVKAHITAILRKLHVFSRTQAVIAARQLGEP